MKSFKQLILEIAHKDPQGKENNPRRGEEFDNYINAMFGDMRGDVQRPWTSKPSKRRPRKPKFTLEYLKRKRQNERGPTTDESHLSWFRDKIGDHLPYTYGIPTSENMRSINLPVRGVRDHGKNFIIDLEADSYAKELENHDIDHVEGFLSHPSWPHEELGKHLTKIGAIHKGKVGRINFDPGNEWKEDREPTLSIHIPKQHVLDAYNRKTQ